MTTVAVMVHGPYEPYEHGLLPVRDGNEIYWEESGNPDGVPALHLHGGPGGGLRHGGYRRPFDPAGYRLIGIDQRGCGRSRPLVIDALDRIDANTTQALIADIESVREHLGIDRWVVTGVSWGSTLALAYAQAHPERVMFIGLVAVTTTSRAEVEWISETVGAVFPEACEAFDAASGREPGERLVEAYARRLVAGTPSERERAAADWDLWETTHISLDPLWTPERAHVDPVQRAVFATLVTHYWSHDGFLTGESAIAQGMDRIAQIPAVLIHGRHDISGPAIAAWNVHRAWPGSRLVIVEEEGHGGPISFDHLTRALDEFAANGGEGMTGIEPA